MTFVHLILTACMLASVAVSRPAAAQTGTLLDDTDRPLLLLFGDRDTETPMASCIPLVEDLRG